MNIYNKFNEEGLGIRPLIREIFLIILFCFSFDIAAQDRETILDSEMEVSYFGGLTLKFAGIKGN